MSVEDTKDSKLLREQAEKVIVETKVPLSPGEKSLQTMEAMLHDLHVHQIELELQNENLRQVEGALQEARDRYFDLFDLAPVAYMTLEPDSTVLEANLTAATLLNITRQKLVHRRISTFLVEDDVYRFHLYRQRVLKNGVKETEKITLQRDDGTFLPVRLESISTKATDEKPPQIRMAMMNLTEITKVKAQAKEGAAELSRTKARFDNVAQSMMDSLIILAPDGTIQDVNPSTCSLLGYSMKELIGKPFSMIIEEDKVLDGLTRGSIVGRSEKNYLAKNGKKIPVIFSGTSLLDEKTGVLESIACIAHDITDIKRREEQIRLTLEAAPIAMFMVDNAHHIVLLNVQAEKLFGYPRSELLGKPIETLVPQDLRATHKQQRQAYSKTPKARPMGQGRELYGRRKNGTLVPIEIALSPVISPEGTRVLASVADMSERKHLEKEIRQAQKMEAIGTLASGVAHDFNNLLMGVSGCANIAASTLEPNSPAQMYLEEIKRSAESGATISRQLLSFARRREVELSVFELNAVVAGAHKMLKRLLGEDIDLVLRLEAEDSWVRADPGQMEQVLINLVVNARHAMPKGGCLIIKSHQVLMKDTNLYSLSAGEYIGLTVTDNGTGMSEETKQRIFEPFFTTKEVGTGSGLGLSTIYGIVTQAGGHINVTTQLNEGSSFEVLLPIVQKPSKSASQIYKVEPDTNELDVGTVLIVEDERTVRMATRFYLEQIGYRVLDAENGPAAIEWCKRYQDRVDLLLTDVILPGMNGAEIAREVEKLRPEIDVLYMSAHSAQWLVDEKKIPPGVQTIQKPFGPEVLLAHIHRMRRKSSFTKQSVVRSASKVSVPEASNAQVTSTVEQLTLLVVEENQIVRAPLCQSLKNIGYEVLEAESGEMAIALAQEHSRPIDILVTNVRISGKLGREVAADLSQQNPALTTIFLSDSSKEVAVREHLIDENDLWLQKPIDAKSIRTMFETYKEAMESPEPSSKTILLVEDESAARLALYEYLKEGGWKVFAAKDGLRALEVCRTNKNGIDILLTDYSLPDMKGDTLAREFKKRYPKASVVYMSGYPDLDLDPTGPILKKPFDLEVVLETITNLMVD